MFDSPANAYDRPCFYAGDHNLHNLPYASSTRNMFGSLKKKLSKRSSNPLSSTTMSSSTPPASSKAAGSRTSGLAPPQDGNFFTSAPATRRPNSSSMNPFSSHREAPPAYTPGPAQSNHVDPPRAISTSTDTDPYAFLKSFDTVFLIDDSGSMAGGLWQQTSRALETIAPICTERDADGIDVYFLNHPDSSLYKNITSAGTVVEIFQTVRPSGHTYTGQRLYQILKPYLQRYKSSPETSKPVNIIVITDGEAQDDVETPIIEAARRLDKLDAPPWQVGIQFFQIGHEEGARKALKRLDDNLKEASGDDELRDIVDTVPFTDENGRGELTAAGILKVVLGSVNKRLDRSSKELHRA